MMYKVYKCNKKKDDKNKIDTIKKRNVKVEKDMKHSVLVICPPVEPGLKTACEGRAPPALA